MPAFAGLVSFTFDPTSAQNGVPTEHATTDEASIIDAPPVKQVLQLGVLREDALWENIMTYANKAKDEASKSDVDWQGSRVFIDLDPRTGEGVDTSGTNLSDQVKTVSFALGLDTTKEMWSMFHFVSNYALIVISRSSSQESPCPPQLRELLRSFCGELRVRRVLV